MSHFYKEPGPDDFRVWFVRVKRVSSDFPPGVVPDVVHITERGGDGWTPRYFTAQGCNVFIHMEDEEDSDDPSLLAEYLTRNGFSRAGRDDPSHAEPVYVRKGPPRARKEST